MLLYANEMGRWNLYNITGVFDINAKRKNIVNKSPVVWLAEEDRRDRKRRRMWINLGMWIFRELFFLSPPPPPPTSCRLFNILFWLLLLFVAYIQDCFLSFFIFRWINVFTMSLSDTLAKTEILRFEKRQRRNRKKENKNEREESTFGIWFLL